MYQADPTPREDSMRVGREGVGMGGKPGNEPTPREDSMKVGRRGGRGVEGGE